MAGSTAPELRARAHRLHLGPTGTFLRPIRTIIQACGMVTHDPVFQY